MNGKPSLEQRLQELARSIPDDPVFKARVMERVRSQPKLQTIRSQLFWRWIMRTGIGLATASILGLVVWLVAFPVAVPVYGLEALPERFQELKLDFCPFHIVMRLG